MPDNIFAASEAMARRLGISRNELFRRAIVSYIEQQNADVRDALNRVYARKTNTGLDASIKAFSVQTLIDSDW